MDKHRLIKFVLQKHKVGDTLSGNDEFDLNMYIDGVKFVNCSLSERRDLRGYCETLKIVESLKKFFRSNHKFKLVLTDEF